jgi:signal transduction histidine kinase
LPGIPAIVTNQVRRIDIFEGGSDNRLREGESVRRTKRQDPARQVRFLLARAVALYLTLVVADGGIVLWLLLHDFDQRVRETKVLEARELGGEIAERIGEELAPEGAIDQLRVIERARLLRQILEEYAARTTTIDVVEIRGPEGGVVLRHRRGGKELRPAGNSFGGAAPVNPDSPPPDAGSPPPPRQRSLAGGGLVIEVPLRSGAGGVALGIAQDAIRAEADALWRDWMFRLLLGGLLSIVLLLVAFAYVLRLIHRTRRLEADAQKAEQLAQLGTLSSGLAHEIRNPLNAMNINLQMLEEELGEGGLSEDSLGLLRSSRAEVLRLERLVKDFLAFAGPPRSTLKTVAPGELVADVVRFSTPEFRAAGVTLELDAADETPEIKVDAARIRQALLNVLQNALEVSSDGDRVSVRVSASPLGEALIEIEDEGPGVPEELRERIFEVFWSRKPAGSGLGLPIAQRAVEIYGGRIEVDRGGSGGGLFRIYLPSAVTSAREADARESTLPGREGGA